jgi:galactitol-specific phosphotransferase system IIC component
MNRKHGSFEDGFLIGFFIGGILGIILLDLLQRGVL